MKIIRYTRKSREILEQAAGVDGGTDAEIVCFEASRPTDCKRCNGSRRVGDSAFPIPCPDCYPRVKNT